MQSIIHEINTDLSTLYIEKPIYVKQGDKNSHVLNIQIYNDGEIYQIEDSVNVRIKASKPDLTQIFNDCTFSNNVITVNLTEQMLTVAGNVRCEVSLYDNDKVLTTFSFNITVVPSVFDPNGAISSDEFDALTKALEEVRPAVEIVEEATQAANLANNAAVAAQTATDNIEAMVEDINTTIDSRVESKLNIPNGIAGLDENGKLVNMPTAQDVGALSGDDVKIEKISLNGIEITPDENKVVNITAATAKQGIDTENHISDATVHVTQADKLNFNSLYTHSKTDTIHYLNNTEGTNNIIFKATADYLYDDTFEVNGEIVTAVLQNGEALKNNYFKTGSMVTAILNEGQLNFKYAGGGGLELPSPAFGAKWSILAPTTIYQIDVDSSYNIYSVGANGFMRKQSSDGTVLWAKNLSTTSSLQSLTCSQDGYIYVAGADKYIRKISQDGEELLSFNTGHLSTINSITTDSKGNIYTVSSDYKVKMFNNKGTSKWTYSGFTKTVYKVLVDSEDNIYCVGSNGILKKLNGSGTEMWSVSFSGVCYDMAIDSDDNIYCVPNSDNYLIKISKNGERIWEKANISNLDQVNSITVDSQGCIYFADLGYNFWKVSQDREILYKYRIYDNVLKHLRCGKDGEVYCYLSGDIAAYNRSVLRLEENLNVDELVDNFGEVNSCEVLENNENYMLIKAYK